MTTNGNHSMAFMISNQFKNYEAKRNRHNRPQSS